MNKESIRSFRDLDAWNVAMQLAVACYRLARRLPPDERFELSAQIRRAAVSVPSNIAEGHASKSPGRFTHHLGIALGSLGELETDLELARRLEFLEDSELAAVEGQIARAGQLLHGLSHSIRLKRVNRLRRVKGVSALALLLAAPLLALAWITPG